jgi:alpha-mannosidase
MGLNSLTQNTDIESELFSFDRAVGDSNNLLDRLKAEVRFAAALAEARPLWRMLIQQAVSDARSALAQGEGIERVVKAAESTLAPIGAFAKQYTVHCVGHGHIDMDWLWNWPETVATTNDTFTTVDRLMDEFPTFHYSQSQASVYQIMQDYLPELYAKVKQRVAEGRWEVTANQWVEGDKNLASGEILCRHILYTKRFFKREFELPYDAVAIDWEPDTFGHAHTIPTILNKAGVRRYYLHRAGPGPMLFWWQGKDGSRVLTFDDRLRGYNGQINADIVKHMLAFEKATGLKDFLFVFGVGDHGGGPTRRDLLAAQQMGQWPIWPNIKLSTTDAFFSIAEQQAKNLPVIDAELNYVFEGCYTAQSNIKRANRKSENALVEAELFALLGRGLAAMPYPVDDLALAWRHAMFNQFHDILPGSGIHSTYEYSQGLFQEILARTSMLKTRALRRIAGMVSIGRVANSSDTPGVNFDVGGGPGDLPGPNDGSITRRGAGGSGSDPFVIFNPSPWPRTELVMMRIWDRTYPSHQIAVQDDKGARFPAQVTERGNYWGHNYIGVAFTAQNVPGLGYRSYHVVNDLRIAGPSATTPLPQRRNWASEAYGDGQGSMENEFLKVEVDQASGAIAHLIDKRTGIDLVPEGGRLGLLEYSLEAPHPMTAWVMGQIASARAFVEGGTIDCPNNGPHLASVRARHALNDSTFTLTISLAAGVPRVDFTLEVNWLERGSPQRGVPMLRVAFPLAVTDGIATFECPNGHVARSTNPRDLASYTSWLGGLYWPASEAVDVRPGDVPAQKWADLTGKHAATAEPVGVAVLNDTKYGYNVDGNTMRLTLLRSSYDPDPLPELGAHTIRFAVQPHVGAWTPSDATRAGYAFNFPFNVVGTDVHEGSLPASAGYAEVLTPNVMLSGMKKAEDGDGLIVRLYEMEGRAITARVRLGAALCAPGAAAIETDLVEQPLATNTASLADGVLSVDVPAFGLVTAQVG